MGGPISSGTLAIAISHMNNRIQSNGLSSKEILLKRDTFTNHNLNFDDDQIKYYRHSKRLQNHGYSEAAKSRGHPPAENTVVSVGDIVYIKHEGTKHRVRDFYLVVSVNYDLNEANVQNVQTGEMLQSEIIYLASANFVPARSRNDDDRDVNFGITMNNNSRDRIILTSQIPDSRPTQPPTPLPIRYPARIRKPPDWLATGEIDRIDFP